MNCILLKSSLLSSTHVYDTATVDKDYSLPTKEVTFTPKDAGPKSISINLVWDYLVEGEEYFSIMFTAKDENKTCLNTAIVTIEDSDGK
jgi:hypothetical protein